jgi:hypothetical protein
MKWRPDYGSTDPQAIRRIHRWLRTDHGMAHFMDECHGAGNWSYDRDADVWVAPDRRHVGPGRGFYVVQRGGDWRAVVLPERVLS